MTQPTIEQLVEHQDLMSPGNPDQARGSPMYLANFFSSLLNDVLTGAKTKTEVTEILRRVSIAITATNDALGTKPVAPPR